MEEQQEGYYYRRSTSHYAALLSTLAQDPLLLPDVPDSPDLATVDALVSAELGNAMRLSVVRMDASSFGTSIATSQYDDLWWSDVLVPPTATVRSLKAAITKRINELEEQELGHRHFSWRHVWGSFCLCHGNVKLVGDSTVLRDVGVRDRDQGSWPPFPCKEATRLAIERRC
ncbi:U11/U12 small nuclear ribonucleoprotein 25 kDa protein-like isoform X2 [Selaginella moellendorffii]|uniref:U11/U12 small nuclear ribonucleoprotein 25 kDa protein-like isoform X2 n=1 Tax=Selaginella moellendorffii TaxID=88036 RepID=UPI000D1C7F2E|nr:U11/U12 small nuclear ribonucleoprotein 25 kDa protein-like isoform X2 [Selaginella moellendorffii]|eukprot:XP_024531083.1 U11/U12 small nuclear ribonucleoprotein 25 kDa protein-like isoform X2 [Selaginella moellendorffii]